MTPPISFHPRNPISPSASGTRATVGHRSLWSRNCSLAESYLRACDACLATARGDEMLDPSLSIPALYLARHAFELLLKDLLGLVIEANRADAKFRTFVEPRSPVEDVWSQHLPTLHRCHRFDEILGAIEAATIGGASDSAISPLRQLAERFEGVERGDPSRLRYARVRPPGPGRRDWRVEDSFSEPAEVEVGALARGVGDALALYEAGLRGDDPEHERAEGLEDFVASHAYVLLAVSHEPYRWVGELCRLTEAGTIRWKHVHRATEVTPEADLGAWQVADERLQAVFNGAPLAILALLSADDEGRPADERVAFFVLARLDDADRVTGVLDAALELTAIVGLAATAAGAP